MKLPYRLERRFRIIRCWLTGGHEEDDYEWGYGMDGMVDLYCPKCGIRFRQVPLEDFSRMGGVIAMVTDDPDEIARFFPELYDQEEEA